MEPVGLPRRKPLPHFPGLEGHNQTILHFITVCTHHRQSVLASPEIHRILREAWRTADSFLVGHYVILPDHLHLFCSPVCPGSDYLQAWVRYWKSLVSNQWPGGKRGKVWQRDFWDTQMRAGESYVRKWDYVRQNPVRHGLVNEAEAWSYQGEMNQLDYRD